MKDFLKAFNNKDAKVMVSTHNIEVTPEFSGVISITKGSLKADFQWYARVYVMELPTNGIFVALDDYDLHTMNNVTFSGVKVDDLFKLRTSMENAGLSALADELKFTDKEKGRSLCLAIQESKEFKNVYGKNAIMTGALSENEYTQLLLLATIENYKDITTATWYAQQFLIKGTDTVSGNPIKTIPPVDDLISYYDSLTLF